VGPLRERAPGGGVIGPLRAAGYLPRALRLVLGDGRLLALALIPTVLTLAAVLGGGALVFTAVEAWVGAAIAGHGAVVAFLLHLLAFSLALAVGYVLFIGVSLVATSPVAGRLSERAEELARGRRPPPVPLITDVARSVGHTLLELIVYLSSTGLLLLVPLVAPPAAPLVGLVGAIDTALLFAFDLFDLPLSRRGASFGEVWRFIGAHKGAALGLGGATALLMAVPGLGLFVAPVAVVAGTLLYCDLTPA
jgi:CysZ protein